MPCSSQSSQSSRVNLPEAIMSTGHTSQDFQKEVFIPQYPRSRSTIAGKRWKRWQVLLSFGIAIALIAGIIGGFIGKAIFDGQPVHRYPNTPFSPPTTNDTLARILPIPSTNCTPPTKRKYLPPAHSVFNQLVHYTTLCATRWNGDHLVSLSAATVSDCIDACGSYNDYAPMKRCLGARFVPLWWNQTKAMEETGKPYNCFLMGDNNTMFANDLSFEVVALCLNSSCPGLVDE